MITTLSGTSLWSSKKQGTVSMKENCRSTMSEISQNHQRQNQEYKKCTNYVVSGSTPLRFIRTLQVKVVLNWAPDFCMRYDVIFH